MSEHRNDHENTSDEGLDEVFNVNAKFANYANMRATKLLTVQRLFPPKPTTLDKEVTMQSLKDKMLRKLKSLKTKDAINMVG